MHPSGYPLFESAAPGPLTPSPLFDQLNSYRIYGRATCDPIAVFDSIENQRTKRVCFTVRDMRFEVARRDIIGDNTLFAEIVLNDLLNNRGTKTI